MFTLKFQNITFCLHVLGTKLVCLFLTMKTTHSLFFFFFFIIIIDLYTLLKVNVSRAGAHTIIPIKKLSFIPSI